MESYKSQTDNAIVTIASYIFGSDTLRQEKFFSTMDGIFRELSQTPENQRFIGYFKNIEKEYFRKLGICEQQGIPLTSDDKKKIAMGLISNGYVDEYLKDSDEETAGIFAKGMAELMPYNGLTTHGMSEDLGQKVQGLEQENQDLSQRCKNLQQSYVTILLENKLLKEKYQQLQETSQTTYVKPEEQDSLIERVEKTTQQNQTLLNANTELHASYAALDLEHDTLETEKTMLDKYTKEFISKAESFYHMISNLVQSKNKHNLERAYQPLAKLIGKIRLESKPNKSLVNGGSKPKHPLRLF